MEAQRGNKTCPKHKTKFFERLHPGYRFQSRATILSKMCGIEIPIWFQSSNHLETKFIAAQLPLDSFARG
jgi:hypothetical protein